MNEVELLKQEIADLRKKVEELLTLSYRQQLRLKNALQGDKSYFVATSSGGSPTKLLTFKDGILTEESASVSSVSSSISPSLSPSLSPSKSPSVSPSVSPS